MILSLKRIILYLCYQFKDLLAFSVAEFQFEKNQNKPWAGLAESAVSDVPTLDQGNVGTFPLVQIFL